MHISDFDFNFPARVFLGKGKFSLLPAMIRSFSQTVLLISGGKSFRVSPYWEKLQSELNALQVKIYDYQVYQEPTVPVIDEIVNRNRNHSIGVVVSIGGGSVIDAGKAVSALLTCPDSILNYLEGVGTKNHAGTKIPFIAVPTTAGTGSEATKNAVISQIGARGFKKSLRHPNFVPNIALIDPQLHLTCPRLITAACAMDAFTQLLEAYVSTQANLLTDSLVVNGLKAASSALLPLCRGELDQLDRRTAMAYASFISGVVLANAGLGTVHGFASAIGGFFAIPHGIICGILLAPVTELTINKLLEQAPGHIALKKYAAVYQLISGTKENQIEKNCQSLIQTLYDWREQAQLSSLAAYQITRADFKRIIDKTGNKNNPFEFDAHDLENILQKSL